MKKQYFIFLTLACVSFISTVQAQSTPIDDFVKKYPSKEGVTSVSVSQQMLQTMFAPSIPSSYSKNQTYGGSSEDSKAATPSPSKLNKEERFFMSLPEELKAPEAYSSISIAKAEKPSNMFADFKKILVNAKYEPYMEINKEDNNVLGYYLKKANSNSNEIVILRQQKEQFSAVYLKGDIEVNQVDSYLQRIRMSLARLGATNQLTMIEPKMSIAFAPNHIGNMNFDTKEMPQVILDAKGMQQVIFDTKEMPQVILDAKGMQQVIEESMKEAKIQMDKALKEHKDYMEKPEKAIEQK